MGMETWTRYNFAKRNRGRLKILGSVATFLSVAFAIVGIVAEASHKYVIGLIATSWYLLAIAGLVFAVVCWIGWAVAVYLNSREPESTEAEGTEPQGTELESKE
jgi:drug/metabolite transporter (DMT)-like permease